MLYLFLFAETLCESLVINNTDTSLSIAGEFEPFGVISDRQAYYNSQSNLYLYYFELTPCNTFWSVGPRLGGPTSVAHVESTEEDIANVSGPWKLLLDGAWVENSDTNVFCV